jgi:hypothetical protein
MNIAKMNTKFTIEKLRSYKGLGHLSDKAAKHIIDTLKTFSIISHEQYVRRTRLK